MLKTAMNSLQTKKESKKGFTLMEMLIVVAIIAILVAIAIPTMSTSLNKARSAADKANLRSAYAEASVDYLEDNTINNATITYGDFTASVSADTNGKLTVKATAGLQCPTSYADYANTYSDGRFSTT